MKKLLSIVLLLSIAATTQLLAGNKLVKTKTTVAAKLDIKIKNDSDDEVTVYNAGSGGSYRLAKNVTTTIKMEAGDKLYIYEGGKKGRLLLTAGSEMDGKLQLFSKL